MMPQPPCPSSITPLENATVIQPAQLWPLLTLNQQQRVRQSLVNIVVQGMLNRPCRRQPQELAHER